jgi:hypothetical protein
MLRKILTSPLKKCMLCWNLCYLNPPHMDRMCPSRFAEDRCEATWCAASRRGHIFCLFGPHLWPKFGSGLRWPRTLRSSTHVRSRL